MANMEEAIRRMKFEYTSEGADQVMQTQEAVAASTTKTDRASLSLEKSFGNLERRYVDTVRHQQDYAKVQATVNAAVAQNPALQERANAVMAAAGQHFSTLATNATTGGVAAGFLSRALSAIIGPAGLIGLAIAGISAAIAYVVEKFQLMTWAVQLASQALGALGFTQLAQSVADTADRMRQLHETTERQKAALQQIYDRYPGINEETAKQLQLHEAQLKVTQARTPEEKAIAQELVDQLSAIQQGKTDYEAYLTAAATRLNTEAQITQQFEAQAAAQQKADDAAARSRYSAADTAKQTEATEDLSKAVSAVSGSYDEWNTAVPGATRATNSMADATNRAADVAVAANQSFDALTGTLITWVDSIFEAIRWGETIAQYLERRKAEDPVQSGTKYESSYDPLGLERQRQGYEDQGIPYTLKTHGRGLGAFQYAAIDFEKVNENLNSLFKSETKLTESTDRLNETIQNALSPFYSQDPRTTALGFRAGVTGNPDWATGATNANPLVAVLGSGATAPGMAGGGSFTVGGGYSANDNKMAVFPVASGEEIVVNRNKEGSGSQVVNIDNRIMVTGSVGEDALSKMKVSRYQQAQRMRAGLAQA